MKPKLGFFDGFGNAGADKYDYNPLPAAATPTPGLLPPASSPNPSRTIFGISLLPVLISVGDYLINVDTTIARNLVLPPNAPAGTMYLFKDITGNAGANPINITTSASTDLIEGAASRSIVAPNGRLILVRDGGNPGSVAGAVPTPPQWRVVLADTANEDNPFNHRRMNGGLAALQLLPTDTLVSVDCSKGAQTLYLPPSPPAGTMMTAEDVGGSAASYPITITFASIGPTNFFASSAPVPVAGSASVAGIDGIQRNAGRVMYYFDGVVWNVLLSSTALFNTRASPSATITLNQDDCLVPFDGTSTITINFPATPRPGQLLIIKETGVTNNTGTITLQLATGQKIQSGTSAVFAASAPAALAASGGAVGFAALAKGLAYRFIYDTITSTWWGV